MSILKSPAITVCVNIRANNSGKKILCVVEYMHNNDTSGVWFYGHPVAAVAF